MKRQEARQIRTTTPASCCVACVLAILFVPAWAAAEVKVVAYVPNWLDLPAFSQTIDYARLTHINVAFENPVNDDGGLSVNRKDDALIERAHANRVKVLVSIGGGAAATNKVLRERYFRLIGDTGRAAFVAKLAEYVAKHDFDGLDVDIEGPTPARSPPTATAYRPISSGLTASV